MSISMGMFLPGLGIPHNDIALNFCSPSSSSRPRLLDQCYRCKAQVTSTIYFYPDLIVSCDESDGKTKAMFGSRMTSLTLLRLKIIVPVVCNWNNINFLFKEV